jgi:tetratricopeptide (TPR) repeat protein
MRRSLFDLRVERIAPPGIHPGVNLELPVALLHPVSGDPQAEQVTQILHSADAAFYSPNYSLAIELYKRSLHFEPSLRQARECLARAEACQTNRIPTTTVPPRAAAGFQRAWDTYTQYRFTEASRWLIEAVLLAKDWGVAEWPEAVILKTQIERGLNGYANYTKAIACFEEGDIDGALEAVAQAFRADPLQVYHSQLETWSKIFEI